MIVEPRGRHNRRWRRRVAYRWRKFVEANPGVLESLIR